MQKIILKIDSEEYNWLDEEGIDCYILSSAMKKSFIEEFKAKADELDKIVLLEGKDAVAFCDMFNLDGVLVDLTSSDDIKSDMAEIREQIGQNKFLGVISRPRRHEAMLISENEPSFVAFKIWQDGFDNLRDLVEWYFGFFLIQLAVIPQDEDLDLSDLKSDIAILDTKKYKILVDKKKSLD